MSTLCRCFRRACPSVYVRANIVAALLGNRPTTAELPRPATQICSARESLMRSAVTASRKYNVAATSHELYSPAAGVRHVPLMYDVERGELWPIDYRFRFDFYFCDFGVSGTNRKVFLPRRRITNTDDGESVYGVGRTAFLWPLLYLVPFRQHLRPVLCQIQITRSM